MDVVREKISRHGPIASVKKVSATGFAVEHVDGHLYIVAVPHEFRVSPIKSVVVLDKQDQGISIALENGDQHAQFFPGRRWPLGSSFPVADGSLNDTEANEPNSATPAKPKLEQA